MDKAEGADKERELKRNKADADAEIKMRPAAPSLVAGPNIKSMPNSHKQMQMALEQIASEGNSRTLPLFTRGPEVEITTQQEVEMLKQTLACNKVHIPTKALERGIVMPRDLDNYHPDFPQIIATLIRNPYREKKETKKKTKAAKVTRGAAAGKLDMMPSQGGKLQHNEKLEFKPSEFGNYPMRNDGKPKSGTFRLMLPSEADWSEKKANVDDKN